MARALQYIFPVANTSDVCALQTTAGASNLILNGNLANQINSQVSFLSHGYSRSVSITTTANLIGRTITVTGTQNSIIITENIAGVNNDTAYGTEIYDVVTSVYINGVAANISVGTGYLGFFPLIDINLERNVINYNLSTAALTTDANTTTIYGTLANIYNNGSTYFDMIGADADNPDNNNFLVIKDSTTDVSTDLQYFLSEDSTDDIYRFILIYINGVDDTEISNSTQMNFVQT